MPIHQGFLPGHPPAISDNYCKQITKMLASGTSVGKQWEAAMAADKVAEKQVAFIPGAAI